MGISKKGMPRTLRSLTRSPKVLPETEEGMPSTDHTYHMAPSYHGHKPYWKRAHRDWRFWAGFFLMLLALCIYVGTNDLSSVPSGREKRLPPSASRVP